MSDFSPSIAIFNHKAYLEEILKHRDAAIDRWIHTVIHGKPRSTSRRALMRWRNRLRSQERRARVWLELYDEAEKIQG